MSPFDGSDVETGGAFGAASFLSARRRLAARMTTAGVENAALDARFMVETAMARGSIDDPSLPVPPAMDENLTSWADRRGRGEPLWRILGEREFWGLTFALSPDTLEPRPDTETLVEAAVELFGTRREDPLSILDLGTGTGCLLIAVATEFPKASGVGIDIAPGAVETARRNAEAHHVADRLAFRRGDWFAGIEGRFDLVLSNPPYIPAREIATLAIEVREHDPLRALDGGADGLDCYRILASGLATVLAPEGLAILEIGAGQETDVVTLMEQAGLDHRGTRHDLGGHSRALIFGRR